MATGGEHVTAGDMATGGEHVAAAGEETPLRKPEQGADVTELEAPSGWAKKLNPIRGGKFEVIFIAPTGEEIKTKRALTQYLKAHPGGPALSEFNWGTGNTPRRSSRLSVKVKATESPEDEKPAKRGRPSSSKKDKKGKQEDAEEAPASSEDEKPAKRKRGRPSGSKKGKKAKQEDAEEASAESGDHVDAVEAKGTEMEMKDADNAEEEKKEADGSQEEKKDVSMVDASEKTEEAEVELPMGADAAEKTEEAKVNTEVSELAEGADAAGKTEDAEINVEFVSELPTAGADAAEKTEEAEGNVVPEVASLEVEKTENGPAIESTGPLSAEKKEEADSTINPATPPPVEINADAPAAEAAKEAENSADKDNEANAVKVDSNGQIQPGASTVKCT